MPTEDVEITINGRRVRVSAEVSVAVALLNSGTNAFRNSVTGESRGPLCGMGICFECRATIDGVAHERTCQTPVRAGMVITTEEGGGR